MSFVGTWQCSNDEQHLGASGRIRQSRDGGYVEMTLSDECIEDGGRPFKEGELVEIVMRRVSNRRLNDTAEPMLR